MNRVQTVSNLDPKDERKGRLAEAEGYEIIRAYRRGVSLRDIGATLGVTQAAMRSSLGAWACRFARIPEDEGVHK